MDSFALHTKRYSVCKYLLEQGCDPECDGPLDRRPIDLAWDAILRGSETPADTMELKTMFRSDDHLESRAFTPLHKSVLKLSLLDSRDLLLASTADINSIDAEGRTPLMWASLRGDITSLEVLVEFNADANMVDMWGKTALHYSSGAGCTNALLKLRPDLDQRDIYNRTALHCASRRPNSLEQARSLLEKGAQINPLDHWSRTPLSYACQFDNVELVDCLLSNNPSGDHSIQDVDGYIPLFTAIEANALDAVKLLLQEACPPEYIMHKTRKNSTIAHVAARSARREMLQLLIKELPWHLGRAAEISPASVLDNEGISALEISEKRIMREPGDMALHAALLDFVRMAEIPQGHGHAQ